MRRWADYQNQGHLSEELTREKPIIALMGTYQIGKSTLLNCLLNDYLALTGKGIATTALTARFRHGEKKSVGYRSLTGRLVPTAVSRLNSDAVFSDIDGDCAFQIEVRNNGHLLKHCDLVDTPGFNANEADTQKTLQAMTDVHYVLFMIPNRMLSQVEKQLIMTLEKRMIPFSVIMNCIYGRREERWLPEHPINMQICQENAAWLSGAGLKHIIQIRGQLVFPFNGLLYWSQLDAFDESRSFIDRADTVHKHIQGLFQEEGIPYTQKSVVAQSHVQQIIDHLLHMTGSYDAVTHRWTRKYYE